MKVIGMTKVGEGYHTTDAYIAIVTHGELCAVMDKCGYHERETVKKLEVGGEFDLASGVNFRSQIKEACQAMSVAMERFEKARATMAAFARMVGKQEGE